MTPAPQTDDSCTHERRPGTTVCLHCRHAARVAAAARRKRLLVRGTIALIVVGLVGVTSAVSAAAIRGRISSKNAKPEAAQVVAAGVVESPKVESPAPAPAVQQAAANATAPLQPAIPQGESILKDGVTATRADSAVTLSFDIPMVRTRIPAKFEQLLRTTLSQVYGAAIDSVLATLPAGAVESQGNLVYELPTRGIHIPVKDAWKLSIYPETRPGQEGPLVVRYRVAVVAKD